MNAAKKADVRRQLVNVNEVYKVGYDVGFEAGYEKAVAEMKAAQDEDDDR